MSRWWALALLLVCGCSTELPEEVDFQKNREGTMLSESFNIEYTYLENDKLNAKAFAPHLYEPYSGVVGRADQQIADRGIKVVFYNPDGKPTSEMTAERATLYNKAGRAVAEGNVVVTNEKGETLETEKLNWYQKQEQISTDQFVRITTKDEILLGDSMVANTKFSNYKIFKLRGTIAVDD